MYSDLIRVVGASVASLWVAALVARPGRPLPGNEIEDLEYSRLLGRYQRVALLALTATAMALLFAVLSLPGHVDADLSIQRQACLPCCGQVYESLGANTRVCNARQPDGTVMQVQIQEDRTWVATPTMTVTDPYVDPLEPYNGSR